MTDAPTRRPGENEAGILGEGRGQKRKTTDSPHDMATWPYHPIPLALGRNYSGAEYARTP